MDRSKLATHKTLLRHRVAATQKSVHAGFCSLRRTRDADDGADASCADSICNARRLGGHRDLWVVGGTALIVLVADRAALVRRPTPPDMAT
jgi:hypothetical protein